MAFPPHTAPTTSIQDDQQHPRHPCGQPAQAERSERPTKRRRDGQPKPKAKHAHSTNAPTSRQQEAKDHPTSVNLDRERGAQPSEGLCGVQRKSARQESSQETPPKVLEQSTNKGNHLRNNPGIQPREQETGKRFLAAIDRGGEGVLEMFHQGGRSCILPTKTDKKASKNEWSGQ